MKPIRYEYLPEHIEGYKDDYWAVYKRYRPLFFLFGFVFALGIIVLNSMF